MTREEAIEILKTDSCTDCGVGAQSPCTCEFDGHCDIKDAMEVAIKALEQEPTTKNDLGVDSVARQDVESCEIPYQSTSGLLNAITYQEATNLEPCEDCIKRKYIRKMLIDIDEAICVGDGFSYEYWKEKLAELPSVQPTVTPQEPILDKIRAEIAELSHYYPMGHDYQIAITRCIAVIDKYKADRSVEE